MENAHNDRINTGGIKLIAARDIKLEFPFDWSTF